ncbi:DUF3343 domain-containing protein [Syntrophomonas wolfei]|uniref:DUF3343 domain-containing protein n=1 Tax=Syntrophomonas wolfei TaxID=863 RepID=A0A354YWS5_9FIRM|nr:DUF3343 domain-containing protein [Syntrophomonas wolfei]HBK52682.1 DUF3343 domain-containing protein [Syntrophomonas wolfei]
MDSGNYDWYVLFPNHHVGLRLKKELDGRDIKARISPTPREASKSCGISLIVDEGDLPMINQIIAENDIEILKIVSLARKEWKYRST